MKPIKLITAFCIIIFICNAVLSQEQDYNLRSVTITIGDTIVKTHACNNVPKKVKIKHAPYYWYHAGKIQMNYGHYSGKLIHGKYEVFDKNSKLIKKGNFNCGLKHGSWMEWYPTGLSKEIIMYDEGVPEGERLTFNNKGLAVSRQSYHKGKLDGKSFYYSKDTIIVKEYKNGIEIIKKKKEPNIKKKKERESERPKLKLRKSEITGNDSIAQKPRKPLFRNVKKIKTDKDEKV